MNKFLYIIIAAVGLSLFTGCSYEDDIDPPNYITFESAEKQISVLSTGSETLEVTVYTANVTGSDRTFTINVDESSTLDASAYNLPSTITVPANSNEVTFTVEIDGAGIDNEGDILVLDLPEDAALSSGDPLTIDVIKVCPFDINTFVGTYDASEVFTAGRNKGYSFAEANDLSLQVELAPNPDDESGNSLILTNSPDFHEFIPNGTVLTFNPAEGTLSLPSDLMVFGRSMVVNSSNLNTCTGNIDFTGDLGTFGQYTVTFDKQ